MSSSSSPVVSAVTQGISDRSDLIDISGKPGIRLDIRYATPNNFTGKNLYGNYRFCYLHTTAASKLEAAVERLGERRPGWSFLIFDCLRPRAVQRMLWDAVKGTAQQEYVADPDKGSVHNFGFAVDLSLADAGGREIDMGTEYDSFAPPARPDREAEMLAAGRLTRKQLDNRMLLRSIMEGAGFLQLPYEWWHYDALPAAEVRAGYTIVE